VDGQGVGSGVGVSTGEGRVRPGREDAPRSAISIRINRVVEMARKKGVEFLHGYVSQLSLLEEDQIRIRREEFRKDITTFDNITQSSNIPTENFDASIH
jgi:hypothetical protein